MLIKNLQNKKNKSYSGLKELIYTEVLKNYNNHIVSYAISHSKSLSQIIDFGAGIGTLSMIFKEKYNLKTICIEIDNKNKKYLKKRNLKNFTYLNEVDVNADLIFSSNVLEHIEDDISILCEMKKKLKRNGKIFLYLPANMYLWSHLDDVVGHYRRYEINDLKKKCNLVGLKIEKLHYSDSAGFFAALLMKIIGYNPDKGIGSLNSLKFYDKWLFPISKMLDIIGFRYIVGKNIVLIAKKI